MYKLTYNITVNSKSLTQKLFINERMVIVSLNEKLSVFIKENNKNYSLDMNNKKKSLIDYSSFKAQIESISKEFGEIEIKKKEIGDIMFGYPSKEYQFTNVKSAPSLSSVIKVVSISNFDKTSYFNYINFEKQNQLINIPLQTDEVIVSNVTELVFLQGIQNQKFELVSIEEWSFPNEYLEICNFSLMY